MANTDAPFGLRPVKKQGAGSYNGGARPYYIPASDSTALFIGDPVIRVAGGSNSADIELAGGNKFGAGQLGAVTKATAGDANLITGVVVGFSPDPTGLENIHRVASTERVAWVVDDPYAEFEIQADGAVPAASVGLNANLIFTNAGSTVTGLSGVELDTTSDAPAADASNQLRILSIVPGPREGDTVNSAGNVCIVRINQHTEAPGALGI